MKIKTLLMAGAMSVAASGSWAGCAFENTQPVSMLSAGYEAWKAVAGAMEECGNFEAELDQEFRTKQPAALAASPSLYSLGGVANGTLTPLLNEGTIRSLNDLVEKYGQNLKPNQLIQIDGDIVAIAHGVNTQHLMYRKDIFDDLGIAVPTTYDEVLAAAETIQQAGVVDYPLGATMMSGWNIAEEFVNMYGGFGGAFTGEAFASISSSEPALNTLNMMKALTDYMDPEYLTSDSTFVQQQFQQSKIAMANLWASRGGAMDDPAESQVVGKIHAASAPLAMQGAAPATTLWWDGTVVAKNISDEQAEAAFRVLMEGIDAEMVAANNDALIWLIDGYAPNRLAEGAIATATAQPAPPSYPSTTEMGLMHSALGNELPAFFTGERDAAATLTAIEAAYTTAAKEAGVLQ
ncbi:MAG: extracellular solute-binding protein [Boseongicola sp.]|nr:extracellular solute-binding protein [Boseongicola sp.]